MPGMGGWWYTRRGEEVRGPFPTGLVCRYVLLGRVRLEDEVSADGERWRRVEEVPELIPQVMKADLSDPVARARLEAARRWADERQRERRRAQAPPPHGRDQRSGRDRRAPEPPELVALRQRRARRERPAPVREPRWAVPLIVLLSAAGLIGGGWLVQQSRAILATPGPDCRAAPAPGVNWDNCFMDGVRLAGEDLRGARFYNARLTGADLGRATLAGANFSYAIMNLADLAGADLEGARLIGASLRRADLRGARLDGANLSYADLTGASLEGASFEGAWLDHAIWPDGTVCAPGSRGRCLPAPGGGAP